MKNIKIIICGLLSAFSLITYTVDTTNLYKPYSTEEFIYTVSNIEKPLLDDDIQLDEPVIIDDTIKHNSFNSGIFRNKITVQTKNDTIVMTIETWTANNPSYLTIQDKIGILLAGSILSDVGIRTNALFLAAVLATGGSLLYTALQQISDAIEVHNSYPIVHIEKYTIEQSIQENIISQKQAKNFRYTENFDNQVVKKITTELDKNITLITLCIENNHGKSLFNKRLNSKNSVTENYFTKYPLTFKQDYNLYEAVRHKVINKITAQTIKDTYKEQDVWKDIIITETITKTDPYSKSTSVSYSLYGKIVKYLGA